MGESAASSLKTRCAQLGVLAVTLCICVAATEVSLRMVLPISRLDEGGPAPSEASNLRYEGSIFSRHVLAAAPLDVQRKEHRYHVNGLGYRGPEFPMEKPEGSLRVAVYGGSAVFDIYASDAGAWPARLEAELVEREVPGVHVINAGIPGHASFDSVGRLFAEGHRFSPDVVLLYNAWNDIKYFGSEKSLLRSFDPYVTQDDPVRTPRGQLDRVLARHSHLYRHLRLRFMLWDQDVGLEGLKARPQQKGYLSQAQLAQYQLGVQQFVDLARNIGAEPVLVTQLRLPVAGSPEEDRERVGYDTVGFEHDVLVHAFEATERILAEVGRAKRVQVVDASAALSGRSELFADHVHLSPEGSAALASFVADALAPTLAVRPHG